MWLKSHLEHPVIFLDSEINNLEANAKTNWEMLRGELEKMPNSWSTQNFWGLQVLESQVSICSKPLNITVMLYTHTKNCIFISILCRTKTANGRRCRFWKRAATLLVTLACYRCNRSPHSQKQHRGSKNEILTHGNLRGRHLLAPWARLPGPFGKSPKLLKKSSAVK